jgi:hypothetical protein
MARRRRRRPPGGHTTAAGSGGRRAPFSTDTASHTHTARSLACPLLTLSSARPFSNGIFRSDGAPAYLPPASSSLTRTRRMDGFCNQNADQLGSLAGLSFPAVYVGVVECACLAPMGDGNACRASDAIRSGTRYAKWAGGSRSQTHRRAAKGGFTQDDGYARGLAPTHDCSSFGSLLHELVSLTVLATIIQSSIPIPVPGQYRLSRCLE